MPGSRVQFTCIEIATATATPSKEAKDSGTASQTNMSFLSIVFVSSLARISLTTRDERAG